MLRTWLISIFLTFASTSASSQTYSVVGVNSDDTLNLREDIDLVETFSNAAVIGAIPHNATDVAGLGLSYELNGTLWRKVQFDGVSGWVSSRFLELTDYPEAIAGLSCGGTEPFWSLKVDEAGGILFDPELDEPLSLSLLAKRNGLNRRDLWAYSLRADNDILTGIVQYTQQCSDGMSDLTYDFEVILLGFRPGEGPAQGCCTVSTAN